MLTTGGIVLTVLSTATTTTGHKHRMVHLIVERVRVACTVSTTERQLMHLLLLHRLRMAVVVVVMMILRSLVVMLLLRLILLEPMLRLMLQMLLLMHWLVLLRMVIELCGIMELFTTTCNNASTIRGARNQYQGGWWGREGQEQI